jgi:DNA-binding NarL/FixJ family response regulator
MHAIRIMYADRKPLLFEAMAKILEPYPDIEMVGFIDTYRSLKINAKLLQPDVILISSSLEDKKDILPWFSFYRKRHFPDIKIIMLTMKGDINYFLTSVLSDVDGFIIKSSSPAALYDCILKVHRGEKVLPVPAPINGTT